MLKQSIEFNELFYILKTVAKKCQMIYLVEMYTNKFI